MKHTLLSLSIIAALSACGSSDDEKSGKFIEPAAPEFFVINEETGEKEVVETFTAVATKHADTGNPKGVYHISDANAGESLYLPLEAAGNYGVLSFNTAGEWEYTLWRGKEFSATPEHPSVTALVKEGLPDLTDTFTITTADGTEKFFEVKIRGINEPATFSGTVEKAVQRDTGEGNATGTVNIADANPAEAGFLPANQQPNVVVETATEQTATIISNYGTITLEVTALVEAVEAVEAVAADPENGIEAVEAVEAVKGVASKVVWTYDLDEMNAEVMALVDSTQSLTDTFTITSLDGTEQLVTILVKGSDPVPATFTGHPGLVQKDGSLATKLNLNQSTAQSSIKVVDPNFEEEKFSAEVSATYGSVTIDDFATGAWTYTVDRDNAEVQKLYYTAEQAAATGFVAPTMDDTLTFSSVDGTTVEVKVTLEGVELVPAVIGGLPEMDGELSAVQVDANVDTRFGALTVTDPNSWQAEFVADSQTTTFGTFTIDAKGDWSYKLNADTLTQLENRTLDVPFNETFTVATKDGKEETLTVSVTSAGEINLGAQIVGTGTGTKVWVMDLPTDTAAVGKASFTLRVPEEQTKDVKVQFHGSEWQGGDVTVHLLSMALQPRSDAIFILDGTGTSTNNNSVQLDQPLVKGELMKFDFTWDGSADTLAANGNKPLLTLKLNGTPVSGNVSVSGSSIVDGVFTSFSTATVDKLDKGPSNFAIWTKDALPIDLDDFVLYSDIEGTTEIFSEHFDADGMSVGGEMTLDYVNAGLTNTTAKGVEFPLVVVDKFLRISNDVANYGGTTLQFPKQEKGSVTLDVRMSTTAQSGYLSLFGGTSGSQGEALVDFDLNKYGAFRVRGTVAKPGYIPVIRYPMDDWFPVEISWDAIGDGTPTVIMKLNDQLVTDIPDFTLDANGSFESKSSKVEDIAEGIHRIAFKCGYKLNDPASVCDFDNVVVKDANGVVVATETFDNLEAGTDAITPDEVLTSGMKTLGTIRNADIVEK